MGLVPQPFIANSNLPSNVKALGEDPNPFFLGCLPKGSERFPSGTVPIKTVRCDMAVGMYQFHDLLCQHEFLKTMTVDEINDNFPSVGILNKG